MAPAAQWPIVKKFAKQKAAAREKTLHVNTKQELLPEASGYVNSVKVSHSKGIKLVKNRL